MIPYQAGIIDVVGDGNLVANNVIDASNAIDILDGIVIAGDRNVARSNTVLVGGFNRTPVFSISGTANTLDGNIAAPERFRRASAYGNGVQG